MLSGALAGAALAALVGLLATDGVRGFRFSEEHAHYGALALILIGASYGVLQFCGSVPKPERLRGVALGSALLLWGLERLLPAGRLATAIDFLVVATLVVDLNLIVFAQLRPGSAPPKQG